MKKKILEYSISFVACAVVTLIVLAIRGVFTETDLKTIYRYFSDSFFTVGVICAGFGLLVAVSNWGAFDFIIYGFMRFISLFKKDHNDIKYKTYYDYSIARAERQKSEFLYLIIVGAIYIIVGAIFLYPYYQV